MKNLHDFERVYDENVGRVRSLLFRLCPRQDVEDLTQECFIKVWKSRNSYRGQSKLSTWIYRIALHTAYDALRRKPASQLREVFEEARLAAQTSASEFLAERHLVIDVLESLSLEHRTVLVLSVLEEMTLSEVAEMLEIAEGTVKSRLFHARENAKNFLAKKGVFHES